MPVYEYRCEACGCQLEVLVRGSAPPTVCGERCPSGRGDGPLVKIISAPAAVSRPESIGHEGPSDKEIGKAGFTKYVREGKGTYRKTAGPGEAYIQKPD
jgi:putative FmdB family regulatory protein